MSKAYLSIGSNLGDRLLFLQEAVRSLRTHPAVSCVEKSALYRSSPWGVTDQGEFYNAVLGVETTLSPQALLAVCQEIEQQAGRVRLRHWGERTLDLDILFYDALSLFEPQLKIPHPYVQARLFVLIPLLDVVDSCLHAQVVQWISACPDQGLVECIAPPAGW